MRHGKILTALLALALIIVGCAESEDTAEAPEAPDDLTEETDTADTDAPEELERVVFRLDFLPGALHVPFVWGVTTGIYEDHGLDVVIAEGRGSAITFQVVSQNVDPLGFADAGVYASGRAEQPDSSTMVANIIQSNPADLLFLCEQGIEEPADLAGKRIAAVPGDAVVGLLPALLEAHGLTMDDVTVTSVAPAARISTVIEGQADIGVGYGHASSVRYLLAGEEAGKEVCNLRLSEWGLETLGHGIIANNEFLEENSDVVRRFVAATQEAFEDVAGNEEEAIEGFQEYFPGTEGEDEALSIGLEVALESLTTDNSEGCPIGWVHPDDAETTVRLLTDHLDLQTDLGPEELFTNDYIEGDC